MPDIARLFRRKRHETRTNFQPSVTHLQPSDVARIPREYLLKGLEIQDKQIEHAEKARKKLEKEAKPIKEKLAKLDLERVRLAKEVKRTPTLAPYQLLPELDRVLSQINQCSKELEKLGIPAQIWDRVPDDPLLQIRYVKDICKDKIFRGEL